MRACVRAHTSLLVTWPVWCVRSWVNLSQLYVYAQWRLNKASAGLPSRHCHLQLVSGPGLSPTRTSLHRHRHRHHPIRPQRVKADSKTGGGFLCWRRVSGISALETEADFCAGDTGDKDTPPLFPLSPPPFLAPSLPLLPLSQAPPPLPDFGRRCLGCGRGDRTGAAR